MKPESKDYANQNSLKKESQGHRYEKSKSYENLNSMVFGTNYAYVEMGGVISKTISSFKRYTSFINPFAVQQGSTHNRLGFAPYNGSKWFMPIPLPNDVSSGRLGTSHFDSSKSSTFNPPDPSQATLPIETFGNLKLHNEPLPLACVRPLQKFNRCKMINGEDKCQEEADAFLATCPNPVLAEMRNAKLQREMHRQIQLVDYKKSITVSDYNQNRSVAEVPLNVNKSTGHRNNIRPDTLWADERYANITPEEIEAAKARRSENQKRLNARLNAKIQEVSPIDSNRQFIPRDDLPVYVK